MVYIRCEDVVGKVSEIIDQEAGLIERMRFYGHLMMCANCRRYFEQFKTVREAAGKVACDKLPEDFDQGVDFDQVMDFVMKEIDQQEGKKDA